MNILGQRRAGTAPGRQDRGTGSPSPDDRDRVTDGPRRETGGRDRGIDGLRAYAIGGVVFGHWLVTGLVLGADGALRMASPLAAMPVLAPVTWLLQTLGLFFFVSGYASARSLGSATARGLTSARWLRRRLGRLGRPVLLLLGGWLVVLTCAALLGTPAATLRTAVTLVASPLWFLLPLVAMVASTGPLARALHRHGPLRLAVPAVTLVTLSDLAGRGIDPAGWPVPLPDGGWRVPVAVLAAWLLPYLLGMALAGGRLGNRRTAVGLLLGGAAGMAGLGLAGYPTSAVGVPGDGMSNLDPPSLFAVCLASAQVGAALLIRPVLAGALARPRRWAAVRRLNRVAISVYLWHQSTLLGVTALVALAAGLSGAGAVPGLHTAPDGPDWIAARLVWLPVFVLVLSVLLGPGRRRARSDPEPA
ncbi:acyltransferase family protein [Plantactinospora sp. WMMC1484]|uniref:acyltransferase family protein n=1 Tax=Plantactinospora sp. WMMC1484 TaxID=3404122 RepID=UPI003BF56400